MADTTPSNQNRSNPDAWAVWLQALCTPDEWTEIRARIAVHDHHLQHLAPPVRNEAIVDALLGDAATNPMLARVFKRMQRHGLARRHARAQQN